MIRTQPHGHLPKTGIATSSLPKNTFWKPPGAPGCTAQATDGVSRPEQNQSVRGGGGGRLASSMQTSLAALMQTADEVVVQHPLNRIRLPIVEDGLRFG